jgi:hypothetical protein
MIHVVVVVAAAIVVGVVAPRRRSTTTILAIEGYRDRYSTMRLTKTQFRIVSKHFS